jgi:hypothetical protein
METKFTPGPWWPTDHGIRDKGGYIAQTHRAQRYPGQDQRYALEVAEREANKFLIAAAPEMALLIREAVNKGVFQGAMRGDAISILSRITVFHGGENDSAR